MGTAPTLISGRLSRRTMSWLVAAVLIVTPLEAMAYDARMALMTLPVRGGILLGMLVALRLNRIGPIVAGRLFLAYGLATMVGWALLLESTPDRVALEAAAYGTILSIFALLVAPKASRRWWSLAVSGTCLIPAVLRLLPDNPALLAQTAAVLLIHSASVAVLDVHANKAERAGEMAGIDPLTGLFNRRPTLQLLNDHLDQVIDGERTSSLVVLDLDHFKSLNDTLGHEAGDGALCRVAALLTSVVRPSDTVCRWGGEEFLVLLPDTDRAAASVTAERLRVRIGDAGVTASFGVAQAVAGDTVTSWVNRADQAMYQAKSNGRNQVSVSLMPTAGAA